MKFNKVSALFGRFFRNMETRLHYHQRTKDEWYKNHCHMYNEALCSSRSCKQGYCPSFRPYYYQLHVTGSLLEDSARFEALVAKELTNLIHDAQGFLGYKPECASCGGYGRELEECQRCVLKDARLFVEERLEGEKQV